MKTIETVINEIKECQELQKKLVEAVKNNAVAEFLQEVGCEASAEEFNAAVKEPAEELSDAELDAVAGGANAIEAVVSIATLGVACAVTAITSALEDNGCEKTEGRLLCETTNFDVPDLNGR